LKRILKEYTQLYEPIFPKSWQMRPLITYEFCKLTKVHIDMQLSNPQLEVDVQVLVQILMSTLEFEEELHKKLGGPEEGELDCREGRVTVGPDGKVSI